MAPAPEIGSLAWYDLDYVVAGLSPSEIAPGLMDLEWPEEDDDSGPAEEAPFPASPDTGGPARTVSVPGELSWFHGLLDMVRVAPRSQVEARRAGPSRRLRKRSSTPLPTYRVAVRPPCHLVIWPQD